MKSIIMPLAASILCSSCNSTQRDAAADIYGAASQVYQAAQAAGLLK